MRKLEKVDYWVWQEGDRWCYRSRRIPYSYGGTDSYVLGLNCRSRESAMAQAGRDLREYGHGARLVPVPDL